MWKLHLRRQSQQLTKMSKIFFFDFDGTLYSHAKKKVSDSVQAALHCLRRDGHIVIFASGRGEESEAFILHETGFVPDYFILMNGQLIKQGDVCLFENFAEPRQMNAMMDFAEENGFCYGGYAAGGMVVNAVNERVQTVWQDFGQEIPKIVPHFQQTIPLYQGQLYITEAEAPLFADYMNDYVVNWSHPFLVNMIPKEAGKSQAIRWCLQHLHASREDTFAFGDGFNDADMLKAVGHGIAMDNATDKLKAEAEYVTASVDEDGVVKALEHYGVL